MFDFVINNMLIVGVCFAMAALGCLIVGLTLTATHPVGFINKRPTLPVKWFISCFALFAISLSWMFCGM